MNVTVHGKRKPLNFDVSGANEFLKEEVFDTAPMLYGDSPVLSSLNTE